MKCPNCFYENNPGQTNCAHCGTPLRHQFAPAASNHTQSTYKTYPSQPVSKKASKGKTPSSYQIPGPQKPQDPKKKPGKSQKIWITAACVATAAAIIAALVLINPFSGVSSKEPVAAAANYGGTKLVPPVVERRTSGKDDSTETEKTDRPSGGGKSDHTVTHAQPIPEGAPVKEDVSSQKPSAKPESQAKKPDSQAPASQAPSSEKPSAQDSTAPKPDSAENSAAGGGQSEQSSTIPDQQGERQIHMYACPLETGWVEIRERALNDGKDLISIKDAKDFEQFQQALRAAGYEPESDIFVLGAARLEKDKPLSWVDEGNASLTDPSGELYKYFNEGQPDPEVMNSDEVVFLIMEDNGKGGWGLSTVTEALLTEKNHAGKFLFYPAVE